MKKYFVFFGGILFIISLVAIYLGKNKLAAIFYSSLIVIGIVIMYQEKRKDR